MIDGGITTAIARTVPIRAEHKAAYTLQHKLWNLVSKLGGIPFVGGKIVDAARHALGGIFPQLTVCFQPWLDSVELRRKQDRL